MFKTPNVNYGPQLQAPRYFLYGKTFGIRTSSFWYQKKKKEREGNRRKNPVEGGAGEEIDENTLFRIKPKP